MKCPTGHKLPHTEAGLGCTKDFCGGQNTEVFDPSALEDIADAPQAKPKAVLPIPARAVNKALKETRARFGDLQTDGQEIARDEQLEKMSRAIGRYEARKAYLKTPDVSQMTPEEAKDFVGKKLDALTPDAIARIEFNLKLGDDMSADKAAYEILDRTGFGKKENGAVQGAPIIIVQQNAPDGTVTTYRPSFLGRDDKKETK